MKEVSVISVSLALFMVFKLTTGMKQHYRAAVFEYKTYMKGVSTVEHLRRNLQAYETATRTASRHGGDIIVFPENGLYPSSLYSLDTRNITSLFAEQIPNPKRKITNPCKQTRTFSDRPVLTKLSCLAKDNRIYIVANMIDFNKCSLIKSCNVKGKRFCKNEDCPDDGMLLYNTNVVFDRRGRLIAKYYKKHLFFEHDRNLPKKLDDTFFETDFGKFTTFVCFDMIFNTSVAALKKSGVKNVAYPTYFFDQIPESFFATPLQQAWAMATNVNLLAADAHVPGTGTMGSGIFSGKQGALVYTGVPDNRSRLLISNVPRTPRSEFTNHNIKRFIINGNTAVEEKKQSSEYFRSNKCQLNLLGPPKSYEGDYRCITLDRSNYVFVKLTKPKDKIRHCANNMCCTLSYEAKSLKEDYFLGIYGNIQKIYNITSLGTEGCFFVRCDSSGSKECKHFVLKSNTVFDYVKLKGNYSAKFLLPYAIDSDIRLTDVRKWEVRRKSEIFYKNGDGKSSLLFLSLLGRHFNQDIDYDTLQRRHGEKN